jgi:hypothetical protein
MGRLPASPSRAQALNELEPLLLRTFEDIAADLSHELRDTMHYALFSVEDRFCVSAAWLLAPRLGIPTARFAPAACALESLRCAAEFRIRATTSPTKPPHTEPALAEAAAIGLVPLAFEMALGSGASVLSLDERAALALVLAHHGSPARVLSATRRELKLAHEGLHRSLDRRSIQELAEERLAPAYRATGEALGQLARGPNAGSPQELGNWFVKLGLFASWASEYSGHSMPSLPFEEVLPAPEALDAIKSLEVELLEQSKDLGFQVAAHDVIEPLADMLKTRLQ